MHEIIFKTTDDLNKHSIIGKKYINETIKAYILKSLYIY